MAESFRSKLLGPLHFGKKALKEYRTNKQEYQRLRELMLKIGEENPNSDKILELYHIYLDAKSGKETNYRLMMQNVERLKEIIAKIESEDIKDEDFRKRQVEAKELKEYTESKKLIKEAEEIVEIDDKDIIDIIEKI